ncbi:DHH phosphoesterase [Xylaria sp. CBS 124048]|nr:DHH phosphoesterase [Xylaria sp. CBS 124048]
MPVARSHKLRISQFQPGFSTLKTAQCFFSVYVHCRLTAGQPIIATTSSPLPLPSPSPHRQTALYPWGIMKRSLSSDSEEKTKTKTKTNTKTKTKSPPIPAYHETPSLLDESGQPIWPAPKDQMDRARRFIRECVTAGERTLIVPDKDADGLSSGVILQKTLVMLGLDPGLISVHHLQKGRNIHDESERQAMAAHKPSFIFILDQGSSKSQPVIDGPHRALIIDHHWALDDHFPEGSERITACNSPPVATGSLLTYTLCTGLHEDVARTCDWLCVVGTHGDLGNSLKWKPPFPDMTATFKTYTKKALNGVVSLVNAPRRTPLFNVAAAWDALSTAPAPADVLKNTVLQKARVEVNGEVERCTHTAPKFSADGRIAYFRITSAAQVHPVIATRWAGHLRSPKLEVVLVANDGYMPGMVHFSCRVPNSAKTRDPPVDILEVLRGIADAAPDATFRDRLGESFAKGHKMASGGVVTDDMFEEFVKLLQSSRQSGGTTADGT